MRPRQGSEPVGHRWSLGPGLPPWFEHGRSARRQQARRRCAGNLAARRSAVLAPARLHSREGVADGRISRLLSVG